MFYHVYIMYYYVFPHPSSSAKYKNPFDCRLWSNSSHAHFKMEEYLEAGLHAIIAIKMNPFYEKVSIHCLICDKSSFICGKNLIPFNIFIYHENKSK